MSRKILIRSKELPYHVTGRTNNREMFHSPLPIVWDVITHQVFEITVLFKAQIHGLVLMPNHFHLLVSTPEQELSIVMKHFMQSVTRILNLKSGRSGRVFGGRYYGSLIDSSLYFTHAFKYVYRNPIRANLCERAEEYSYSSLKGLLGEVHLPFPIHFPFQLGGYLGISEAIEQQLEWINRPFKIEHENAIRAGLRKTSFSPPKTWKNTFEELRAEQA